MQRIAPPVRLGLVSRSWARSPRRARIGDQRKRHRAAAGLAACLVALVSAPGAGAAPAAGAACQGREATIVGTSGDDTLEGTDHNDVIVGGRGDDRITGLGRKDVICGGAGRDVIDAGSLHDEVWGGADDDRIDGGRNDDDLYGGTGDDVIRGGPGDPDKTDLLFGGPGADRLIGTRTDLADYSDSPRRVVVHLDTGTARGQGHDTLVNLDGARGSALDDVVIGSRETNRVFAGDGDDRIRTKGFGDFVLAQAGEDLVIGGAGPDFLSGNGGDDVIDGGSGDDNLTGGGGHDSCENGEETHDCE